MVTIHGIRNCDSCRAARAWLRRHGIDHEYVDIRVDGLSASQLERWQAAVGWEPLLNRRSITWRKIPAFDRDNLDADTARALILEHPTVMRRPVLDTGTGQVLLGFDADRYQELLTGNT